MRWLQLIGIPGVGICAIAAVAFALVGMLPSPSAADRVAVRVLDRLDSTHGRGGQMVLAGRRIGVSCRRLRDARHLISLSDGTKLILAGTHVRVRLAESSPRMLAAVTHPSEMAAAEADLSGSHTLYVKQLTALLAHGHPTVAPAMVRGEEAYRIRLTRDRPVVDLYVAQATLRPLEVAFRSSALAGVTWLSRSARLNTWGSC